MTKRGRQVRAVAIIAGLFLIWQVATSLWWVGTDAPTAEFLGYCWGSMQECAPL